MDGRANRIFGSMRGANDAKGTRMSADGTVPGTAENPIPLPKTTTEDKGSKMKGNAKWAMYGGGIGLLFAIIAEKGIVKFTLAGAAVGLISGWFWGGNKKPETQEDATDLINEILASGSQLTTEGVDLLKTEYGKMAAKLDEIKNDSRTKDAQQSLMKDMEVIKTKLKESGVNIN